MALIHKDDLIAEMLVDTDLSITEIASAVGYSSPANIAKYFRKEKKIGKLSFYLLFYLSIRTKEIHFFISC